MTKLFRKLIILILLLVGCSKNDKVYITGFIIKAVRPPFTYYYKEVYVHNQRGFKMVPNCLINDTALNIDDYHYDYYFFRDYKPFEINRKYKLVLEHAGGKAQGEVYMPNDFAILYPESTYLLVKDSSLQIYWTKAEGATWYWLDIYIDYWYEDSLGEEDEFVFDMDTIVYSNYVVYEKSRLFPPYVARITEGGDGIINVWACDGPPCLPGAEGNIYGAGYGIYNSVNEAPDRFFYVGLPGKRERASRYFNQKLEKLKIRNRARR
ncbi:MAG: hypothetical protein ABIK93_02985 [candidate division WOR-3 bacterium]